MVTTAQQFVFEDGSFSELPGLIFSSRYGTLSAAVTDASGVNGILVVDQDWPLAGSISIDCDMMAGGGLISCPDGDTITVSGRVVGDSQIFDVTAWSGDPTLTGGVPTSAFPVILTQCTNAKAVWFGAVTASTQTDTRLALQAAFCAVGSSIVDPYGVTVEIAAGHTYIFDNNPSQPYGILIPEHRTITVRAEGAVFDYRGSQLEGGDGTCAFAWYSNQFPDNYFFSGLEWHGGIALPETVGTNSDFMWLNGRGSRSAVHGLQIGQLSTDADTKTGHRNGIVYCQWTSGQVFTGQRIVIDNCDVAFCTDTGIVVVECDAALISGCRIRENGGSGIELGCSTLRTYNHVQQNGVCSSPKVISCNFEENTLSGVKCINARDSLITSDFENNALNKISSDANVDFSGLYGLALLTADSISGHATLTGASVNPMTLGLKVGMVVKDQQGKVPSVRTVTGWDSTSITLSGGMPTTNTGLVLSFFLGTGDKEGRALCSTWSNSDAVSGNPSLNVITQSATVLDENLHKGVTAQETGVLHLATDQPLWCTKEVFTFSTPTSRTLFSSNSWSGGIVVRESAVTYNLPLATTISQGTTTATGKLLTPFFSLDSQAVMVEAGGLFGTTGGVNTSYVLQLFDSTGALIQTLTQGNARWEEGPYHSQRCGARLAHLTQSTVSGWSSGKLYAVYAMNLTTGTPTSDVFYGGVVLRYCPIMPSWS